MAPDAEKKNDRESTIEYIEKDGLLRPGSPVCSRPRYAVPGFSGLGRNGGPVQTRTADLYRVKVAVGTQVIEFIEAFGRSGVLKSSVRALIAAISQSEGLLDTAVRLPGWRLPGPVAEHFV